MSFDDCSQSNTIPSIPQRAQRFEPFVAVLEARLPTSSRSSYLLGRVLGQHFDTGPRHLVCALSCETSGSGRTASKPSPVPW